jgi:hypothetical protein
MTEANRAEPVHRAGRFSWPVGAGQGPAPESAARPGGPVVSLLALADALLAAYADGRIVVYPVRIDAEPVLGGSAELCRLDGPAVGMVFCGGEVVAAAGSRLERVRPDGTVLEALELDAPVGALTARRGRIYAVAGDTVHVLERDGGERGDGWTWVYRTAVPLSDCHDIDVDRRGKHVVVCQRPGLGSVVELETGAVVGHCNQPASDRKTVTESYARFSPVTDHLYRASSRAHWLEKLAKLGKSGRSLGWKHRLTQPSTWCTPLASSPDGRYVASRQSGVGVLVWDLQDAAQVLFAELDDAPEQEKFAKRMRREPAVVKQLGPGAVTVKRWQTLPGQDGETTAVAVAPGAAYAATGDRHGVLTVVTGRTRRIEQSDGRLRQRGCRSAVIPVDGVLTSTFTATEWIGISADGTVTVVDLATAQAHSPGSVDLEGLTGTGPALHVDGDELVLIGGPNAGAFDRRTLACVWRADAPLPDCHDLSYSGTELLAVDKPDGPARRIHRYQPRTGDHTLGPTVRSDPADSWISGVVRSHRTGGFFVHTRQRSDGDQRWYQVLPDGELGARLPRRARMLPDGKHAVSSSVSGWQLFDLESPDRPGTVVDDIEVALGRPHVDPALGLVAADDFHTKRVHIWTVAGEPVASFDGVGENLLRSLAFAGGSLWLHSWRQRSEQHWLYRLDMPA